jgi:hypothetical protein
MKVEDKAIPLPYARDTAADPGDEVGPLRFL